MANEPETAIKIDAETRCPAWLTTTLGAIRKHGPCAVGWSKLTHALGTSEPATEVSLLQILESNGLDHALWSARAFDTPKAERFWRLFACACAEATLPIWEHQFPEDGRPRLAIATARRFADGEATLSELHAAEAAALSAVQNAAETTDAGAARYAADAAASAASVSAADGRSAASAVTCSAAKTAAAELTAGTATWYAAWDARRALLVRMIEEAN